MKKDGERFLPGVWVGKVCDWIAHALNYTVPLGAEDAVIALDPKDRTQMRARNYLLIRKRILEESGVRFPALRLLPPLFFPAKSY